MLKLASGLLKSSEHRCLLKSQHHITQTTLSINYEIASSPYPSENHSFTGKIVFYKNQNLKKNNFKFHF